MPDKGTISLTSIWTEAECIAVHVCIVEERPHIDAARILNVSDRTIRRLITSAFEAAREAREAGWDVNLENYCFPCPE